MTINLKIGAAALLIAASSTCAMAQATGTENNATTGSQTGPASGAEQKGSTGSSATEMKPPMGSTSSTGAGSAGEPSGTYGTADKPAVGGKTEPSR